MTMTHARRSDRRRPRQPDDRRRRPASSVYDRALDRLVRFHPEVVDLATELAGRTSQCRWPTRPVAYLHLMSTDADDLATATEC